MKFQFQISVRTRYVLGAVAIVLCLGVLSSAAFERIVRRHVLTTFESRVDHLLDKLGVCVRESGRDGKTSDATQVMVTTAVQQHGISFAACFNNRGELLAASLGPEAPAGFQLEEYARSHDARLLKPLRSQKIDVSESPVLVDPDRPRSARSSMHQAPTRVSVVGSVMVGHRRAAVESQIATLVRGIRVAAFVACLVAAGLVLLGASSLVQPIHRLIRGAERLSRGERDVALSVDSRDEVGELARSFNSMANEVTRTQSRLESKNANLHATVQERTAELRRTYAELRQLNDRKEAFLSSLSHELRTPLTSMCSFAEILCSDGIDSETEQEFLDILCVSSRQLQVLVARLAFLCRLDAEDRTLRAIPCDPLRCIEEAVRNVRERHPDDLQVEIEVDPDLPDVCWEVALMRRLVEELLDNAARFAGSDSPVRVALETAGDRVRLIVRDRGPGVSLRQIEAIFDRFAQGGETLTDKPAGIGLGLPICRRIAEMHGGQIQARPAKGGGLEVVVKVPNLASESRPLEADREPMLAGHVPMDPIS